MVLNLVVCGCQSFFLLELSLDCFYGIVSIPSRYTRSHGGGGEDGTCDHTVCPEDQKPLEYSAVSPLSHLVSMIFYEPSRKVKKVTTTYVRPKQISKCDLH